MKFQPLPLPSSKDIPRYVKEMFLSKRRLAGAKRAVQKQKEKWGLFFDELAEFKTPEERIRQNIEKYTIRYIEWRKEEAREWREARAMYFSLPNDLKQMVFSLYQSGKLGGYKSYRLKSLVRTAIQNPEKIYFNYEIFVNKKREFIKIQHHLEVLYSKLLKCIYKKYGKLFHEAGYYKGTFYFLKINGELEKLSKEEELKVKSCLKKLFSKAGLKREIKNFKYLKNN